MAPLLPLLLAAASAGRSLDGEYIVRLADESPATHEMLLRDASPLAPAAVFRIGALRLAHFRGVNATALRQLRGSRAVRYAEANGRMRALAEQRDPPSWGLPRVGQRDLPLQDVYRYKDTAGRGVDSYIVDTGILLTHNDFGGRATWGFTAPEHEHEGQVDGNGHGTHCAGTVGGTAYGVAKETNLIAVKVLGNSGSGSYDAVISGIEYAATQRQQTGRPSVINLSLGGGRSEAVNDAIDAAAAAGVHNSIAAGNDNRADACTKSPASAPRAFTVAAADRSDDTASFTNIGTCVDIWAPGVSIVAPYIGSDTATATLSGTSMAAPHVAGVMALVLGDRGDMPAADLAAALTALATPDVIRYPAKRGRGAAANVTAPARACSADGDCFFPDSVCCPSVGGAPRHCTSLFEICCGGGVCREFGGERDVCCTPDERQAHCCPAGNTCLPDGGCFNPLWDATPNRNLYSDPPARSH